MPVHDWSRVEAGIFHAFHQQWLVALSVALNDGLLPPDYYALPEQYAAGFGPDVLTLQGKIDGDEPRSDLAEDPPEEQQRPATGLLLAKPRLPVTAETGLEFYRRKQTTLAVRHVGGDRVVAMIEIVSPGNKSSRNAMRAFVEKACFLLDRRIHLLLVDVLRPGRRDPNGIHAAVWEELSGDDGYELPAEKRLTVAAYEANLAVKAYVRHFAVGDALVDMPLFLEPDACVQAPLEATYATAFAWTPKRWRDVLETLF